MKKMDFKGKLVVVTGASSGLGYAIARAFALDQHADVVAAARRRERLEQLKAEVEGQGTSRVHLLPVDLGAADGAEVLFREATRIGRVFALVNCAGLTYFGPALEGTPEKYAEIMSVNFVSAMKASLLFLDYFLKHGEGALLNVTSGAALIPLPYQSVYSASKHALQAFTQSLSGEYRGRGVTISCFAPGGIDTELIKSAGIDKRRAGAKQFLMDPDKAARLAVRALKRGRLSYIPGFMNRAGLTLARVLPVRLVLAIFAKAYQK